MSGFHAELGPLVVNSRFQIPMRGNEAERRVASTVEGSKFQIPMRGNEIDSLALGSAIRTGFKSP